MEMNILNWTETYLKYKDTIHRRIKTLEKKEKKKEIITKHKDGSEQVYICVNDLNEIDIKKHKEKRISCLNTKKNFEWLVKNWEDVKEQKIIFLFANPKKASHWSINPAIHNNITEKGSVKQGLKTLFESTPEV